ncbi:MAG TPA: hypothetical protein VGL93_14540 [Streptosporangiaceae bacterium]
MGANLGDERRTEPNSGVVVLDRLFQMRHVDVWRVAGAVVASSTEEVQIDRVVAVDRVLHDHALGDAGSAAAAAEQRPLEVMVVYSTAFLGGRAGLDDLLDLLEQFLADEGLVPTFVLLALVHEVADVVTVTQDLG